MDISGKLLDFACCGVTSDERIALRREAVDEIYRLNLSIVVLKQALEKIRGNDNLSVIWHIADSVLNRVP